MRSKLEKVSDLQEGNVEIEAAIEEENDDLPVGRVLSRREVLALFGMVGASALVACATPATTAEPTVAATVAPTATPQPTAAATVEATAVATAQAASTTVVPSCVVRPEMTEGPYFVDGQLERTDIRTEPTDNSVKEGIPLMLAVVVAQVTDATCAPLAGATVDIWHCDALGIYSGVSDPGFDTSNQSWLRGYQVTDANGRVEFTTIYPGWYSGRAVHIHFKIRTTVTGNETYEFTSQFFFNEALNDVVHSQPPYNSKGQRNTLNSTDNIFSNGGEQMTLNVVEANGGYATTFDIALDLSDSAVGASDASGQGGGRGRP
jgi:protocatechuate 3,4-dioxygenase beta subunit